MTNVTTEDLATLQIMREELVRQINESRVRQVELATLPAEMALLAAQQVNEVRLNALETPKDVGWGAIAFEFVLSFAIHSSFAEKLATKVFQRVYGRILSSQLALDRLPKSVFGKELISNLAKAESNASPYMYKALKNLGTTGVVTSKTANLNLGLGKQLIAAEKALVTELGKYAKLSAAKKEDLKIYAQWINEFTRETQNASALVKATKDAIRTGPTKKASGLSTTDGSSVTVMEHFLSAARAQRLHVESLHNHYEYIARAFPLSSDSFVRLQEMFDINPIFESLGESVNLEELSSGMRIRMEAMIWAVHLGFSSERQMPNVQLNATNTNDVFSSINEKIVRYLFDRYGDLVVQYKASKGGEINWSQQTPGVKGFYLREYFWAITDELKK